MIDESELSLPEDVLVSDTGRGEVGGEMFRGEVGGETCEGLGAGPGDDKGDSS